MSERLVALRRYLESQALTAKARGRDDRDWLDALILLEKAEAADRDAAGVEALSMVSGLLMAYGDESSDEFLVHQLRAALSGPADEHPADGTGA